MLLAAGHQVSELERLSLRQIVNLGELCEEGWKIRAINELVVQYTKLKGK